MYFSFLCLNSIIFDTIHKIIIQYDIQLNLLNFFQYICLFHVYIVINWYNMKYINLKKKKSISKWIYFQYIVVLSRGCKKNGNDYWRKELWNHHHIVLVILLTKRVWSKISLISNIHYLYVVVVALIDNFHLLMNTSI